MSETSKWIKTGNIEEWYGEERVCSACGMITIEWNKRGGAWKAKTF